MMVEGREDSDEAGKDLRLQRGAGSDKDPEASWWEGSVRGSSQGTRRKPGSWLVHFWDEVSSVVEGWAEMEAV